MLHNTKGRRMLKQVSTVVVCLVASSSMAFAEVATTGATVGTVLVNHGNGFVPVGAGAPLSPGDIVSAKRGGRTSIVFEGGCTVNVKPGRTVTIGQTVCDQAVAGEGVPGAPISAAGGALLGGAALTAAGIGAAIALGAQRVNVGPFPTGGNRGPRPVPPNPVSP